MESAFFTYRTLSRDLPRALAQKAAEASVARAVQHYLEHIAQVRGVDDLLCQPRLWRFALAAFDLGHMAWARGHMRRLLVEGAEDPRGLARRVDDTRFRAFAAAFDFAGREAAAPGAEAGRPVTALYVHAALERDEGAINPGVRLALYFRRRAPCCARAPLPSRALAADRDLWAVARLALDLPETADPDMRALALAALDPAALEDPVRLDALLRRFCVKWDARQRAAGVFRLPLGGAATWPAPGAQPAAA